MSFKVLVPMATGCEELEAVTMINLFRRAAFTVISAGLEIERKPVECARGTLIIPDTTLDLALVEDYDLVVLPGGQPGTNNLMADQRIIDLLQNMQRNDKFIGAICAAPMVLGKAGVLEGKSATSYPGCLDSMGLSGVDFLEDAVVVDGKVITSRGPGTAMDFALKLIEILAGHEVSKQVENGLQRAQ